MMFRFRADIQGLRAICVAMVVIYHAQKAALPGGFIGVDVFFVLSGYLITSLLLSAPENASILGFWSRRARRLLPNALLVLVLTFAVFAAITAYPRALAIDFFGALAYFANYVFALRATDYFAPEHTTPFLHFWSLSVEEQYYFVFPLMFALLMRKGRTWLLAALILVAVASFATSIYYLTLSQPAAFFRTEARIWQIACGGILACIPRDRIGPALRPLLGWAGLVGLIAAAFLLDDSHYPGWPALLPVAAALAFLAGDNADSGPTRVLGNAIVQRIGDASYSLYLWHFPPMVLAEQLWPDVEYARAASLIVSVPLAFLAYAYVEKPFRKHAGTAPKRVLITALAAQLVLAGLVFGSARALSLGASPAQRWAEAAKLDVTNIGNCQAGLLRPENHICTFGAKDAARKVVLFGDSFAGHLFEGANKAAKARDRQLLVRVKPGCTTIIGYAYNAELRAPDTPCMEWRNAVAREIAEIKPELVILATRVAASRMMFDPATEKRLSPAASRAAWDAGYRAMIDALRASGARVAVIAPVPHPRNKLFDCLAIRPAEQCGRPRLDALKEDQPAMDVVATLPDIETIDIVSRLCSNNVCRPSVDGMPVYHDNPGHLTRSFSLTLAPEFERLMP